MVVTYLYQNKYWIKCYVGSSIWPLFDLQINEELSDYICGFEKE
jgi:hypothetical protein